MASEEMDDAKTQPMPPDYPVERTDREVALETITWEARRHFGKTHWDDWMELQRKAHHPRYWSVNPSDVPNCKICLAYAAALEALAEPDEEEPDV